MNKQELIALVAEENNIAKAQAERVINSVFKNIVKALARGDAFQLVGFGQFKPVKRKARMARNPSTGESIEVPATTVPKFVAGKTFMNAVAK